MSVAASTVPSSSPFAGTVFALAGREWVRFFRQRTRVIGALGQPVIFWILFGAGFRGSFDPPEWAARSMSYQEYFFPGIAVLILLFTAIFSTISIIEDRREGFLQGVLVAPVPRTALVLGKLAGGTLLAILQALLFLILGPALGWVGLAPEMTFSIGVVQGIGILLWLGLVGFALCSLGYMIAWPMNSTQGFHAIMSVFLLPLWLLSGAIFPGQTPWLETVIAINPLSYGLAGLRHLLAGPGTLSEASGLPGFPLCVAVTLAFATIGLLICVWQTRRQTNPDRR